MHTKLLNVDPPITYAVVLDTGDEVAGELGRFVRENEVEAASITAIGAFRDALLGYFDWPTKQYKKIPVDEQVEVLSLIGDVAVARLAGLLELLCRNKHRHRCHNLTRDAPNRRRARNRSMYSRPDYFPC